MPAELKILLFALVTMVLFTWPSHICTCIRYYWLTNQIVHRSFFACSLCCTYARAKDKSTKLYCRTFLQHPVQKLLKSGARTLKVFVTWTFEVFVRKSPSLGDTVISSNTNWPQHIVLFFWPLVRFTESLNHEIIAVSPSHLVIFGRIWRHKTADVYHVVFNDIENKSVAMTAKSGTVKFCNCWFRLMVLLQLTLFNMVLSYPRFLWSWCALSWYWNQAVHVSRVWKSRISLPFTLGILIHPKMPDEVRVLWQYRIQ